MDTTRCTVACTQLKMIKARLTKGNDSRECLRCYLLNQNKCTLTHSPHLGGIGFVKCGLIVIVPLKPH